MKIAVPTKNNMVDDHFGHCEYFTVFTVDGEKKIVSEEKVESQAGCGCKSNIVGVLSQMGVQVMLAGNMGNGAVNVLGTHGIDVFRGCSGPVKDVAEGWLKGDIKDSGVGCSSHEHDCGH
jgi:predicted Fe-Mo cluster-binding NifX family protein